MVPMQNFGACIATVRVDHQVMGSHTRSLYCHEDPTSKLLYRTGNIGMVIPCRSAALIPLKAVYLLQMMQKWLHMRPYLPQAWVLTSLLALQSALSSASLAKLQKAVRLLDSAISVASNAGLAEEYHCLQLAKAECHLQLAAVKHFPYIALEHNQDKSLHHRDIV